MKRAVWSVCLCLVAPAARAQGIDAAVSRCLRLGVAPSPAAQAIMARWLPPRPTQLSLAAGFAVGPDGSPHGSAGLRLEVAAASPFYAEAQVRGLLGARLWLGADLLVGVTVAAHRATRWRGDASATVAPWREDAPTDDAGLARWMAARERDCGVSQGAWRVLTGARLLTPIDGVDAGPPLQFALALGVARAASSYGGGTRTGLDLGIYGLFDPQRLSPGVMGRVAASWDRLVFALDGAWLMGAQGYAYVTLEVGVRLSR
ncbi:MAG: hypothetical protein U0325_20945 [Polyangiales bacterium]